MKVAAGVLSIILAITTFLFSLIVGIGGSAIHNGGYQSGGAVGLFTAALCLAGGICAFTLRLTSAIILGLAAFISILGGAVNGFSSLVMFGVLMGVFSVMMAVDWHLNNERKAKSPPPSVDQVRQVEPTPVPAPPRIPTPVG